MSDSGRATWRRRRRCAKLRGGTWTLRVLVPLRPALPSHPIPPSAPVQGSSVHLGSVTAFYSPLPCLSPGLSCLMEAKGVNSLAYDEAIVAQQDRIQQEIATSNPLVSERQALSVLEAEYAEDDTVYQQKIKDLHRKYSHIRKTRPDGNCFYRAFGFSHLESLLDDTKELQRFKAVAAKSKLDLVSQGFTEFTIEDFHNTFMDLIEMCEKQPCLDELLGAFNDQSVSDYVVVYLRLLTSGFLQREHTFFQHFIEGGRSIKEFCQQEVEPMSKESDHIHIIALAQALNVPVLVEYMDRGEGGTVNNHVFPEGSDPRIFLLYRPGHYDILYK